MGTRIQLYTRKGCGYCTAAERLLEHEHLSYDHIDISDDRAMRLAIVQRTGRTTLPQIFIDGKSIGGFTELRALDRSGELDKLLAA